MSGDLTQRALGLAMMLVAASLLAGCGKHSTRSDGATGALGTDAPSSPGDVYVALAGEYYARGQMDVALQRANQALNEDSNNAKAHLVNALIYQRLGETGKAETHFKRAVELDPKDPSIRNALGTYYCAQRNYAEADEQFKQALTNPLYATPWTARTNAAICAKASGDRAKAQTYFRKALDDNPNFGPALLAIVRARSCSGRRALGQLPAHALFQVVAANAPGPGPGRARRTSTRKQEGCGELRDPPETTVSEHA